MPMTGRVTSLPKKRTVESPVRSILGQDRPLTRADQAASTAHVRVSHLSCWPPLDKHPSIVSECSVRTTAHQTMLSQCNVSVLGLWLLGVSPSWTWVSVGNTLALQRNASLSSISGGGWHGWARAECSRHPSPPLVCLYYVPGPELRRSQAACISFGYYRYEWSWPLENKRRSTSARPG